MEVRKTEYSIHTLAQLSGVSTRTLRYYDQIGLLPPLRTGDNGYRYYGQEQVDRLQQILFYRELGVSLDTIRQILCAEHFDPLAALTQHLTALQAKQEQTERLIQTVQHTIQSLRGEKAMTNEEKFEGFKQSLIEENETTYGAEIRQSYGDEAVDASNAKLSGMTPGQWAEQEALAEQIAALLRSAVATGDPHCAEAQAACDKHRQWLCLFWKDGTYSKAAHAGMGELYAADERFRAYYEAIAPGCAAFFRDALAVYCAD